MVENGILLYINSVENGKCSVVNLVENGILILKHLVGNIKSIIFALKSKTMAEDIIRFKRKMYDTMLKWKQERNGDTALLIQELVALANQLLPRSLHEMSISHIY